METETMPLIHEGWEIHAWKQVITDRWVGMAMKHGEDLDKTQTMLAGEHETESGVIKYLKHEIEMYGN